jgi:predicted lipoprotein with Yx(FWY)xxD motif
VIREPEVAATVDLPNRRSRHDSQQTHPLPRQRRGDTAGRSGRRGGGGAATAAAPKTSTGASATVGVAKTSLGSILVNSTGRTLYLFKADVGSKSACSGACATAWPPLLSSGKPTAGSGLTASKLGTIARSGGSQQVTYNGHPVYRFIKDQKPGQTTGQGVTAFGAAWFALSPSGKPDLRHPSDPGHRWELRRRRLLAKRPTPTHANRRSNHDKQ